MRLRGADSSRARRLAHSPLRSAAPSSAHPPAGTRAGCILARAQARGSQTLEAIGETLAIGARQYGIAHFVDSQLAVPPEQALLTIRVTETRPPYLNFYRAALAGIERASQAKHQRTYATLDAAEQRDFVNALRQGKLESWQGHHKPTSI
jgi:hypothetical protein